jgi:hypothetical protein
MTRDPATLQCHCWAAEQTTTRDPATRDDPATTRTTTRDPATLPCHRCQSAGLADSGPGPAGRPTWTRQSIGADSDYNVDGRGPGRLGVLRRGSASMPVCQKGRRSTTSSAACKYLRRRRRHSAAAATTLPRQCLQTAEDVEVPPCFQGHPSQLE